MSSSIKAARANLYTLLAAQTAAAAPLENVQVTFGQPNAYEEQRVVAILGFGPVGDEPAAIGQRRQDETYRITVAIKVHDPAATTGQEVEDDAMGLYDAVWNVVHDNPTLSGAVTFCFPGGGDASEGAQPAEGGGWVVFVNIGVDCTARIART